MMIRLWLTISLLFSIATAGNIEVKNAYVRAVPPMMHTSAAYMNIVNRGDKDKTLVSINSSVAKMVQLHKTVMGKKMMKMIPIKMLVIPTKGHVELKPGGYHIMLMGLKKVLRQKDKVDSITLHFSDNTSITVKDVPIKSIMSKMKM